MDVGCVYDARALGLGQYEVEEEEQADVGIQWDPAYNSSLESLGSFTGLPGHAPHEEPFCPALNQKGACKHDPVHEPWRQLGRIGGLERLVGCEEGEEEGGDGRQEFREYVEHGH